VTRREARTLVQDTNILAAEVNYPTAHYRTTRWGRRQGRLRRDGRRRLRPAGEARRAVVSLSPAGRPLPADQARGGAFQGRRRQQRGRARRATLADNDTTRSCPRRPPHFRGSSPVLLDEYDAKTDECDRLRDENEELREHVGELEQQLEELNSGIMNR
jgi:hypothetical protein